MAGHSILTKGSIAPNFTLPDGLGNHIALNDTFGQKGVLLAFIHNTWCPECMRGVMGLRRTHWMIQRLGIRLLIIANQSEASLTAYLMSLPHPLPFPILADSNGKIFSQYQLDANRDLHQVKATFFIDASGVVQKARVGLTTGLLTPFGI